MIYLAWFAGLMASIAFTLAVTYIVAKWENLE